MITPFALNKFSLRGWVGHPALINIGGGATLSLDFINQRYSVGSAP